MKIIKIKQFIKLMIWNCKAGFYEEIVMQNFGSIESLFKLAGTEFVSKCLFWAS